MRATRTLGAVVTLALATAACVDLFHDTTFETFCDRSPSDRQCLASSGTDAQVPGNDGGPVPHADFCAMTAAEANRTALESCAWLGACLGSLPIGGNSLGTCTVAAEQAYNCEASPDLRPAGALDAFWGCMLTARTCAAVTACAFPSGVQGCNGVDGGYDQCANVGANTSTMVRCEGPASGPAVGVAPCVMSGRTCGSTPGVEFKAKAYCVGSAGAACTTAAPSCSGTNVISCGADQRDVGYDCALYGATCSLDGTTPVCVPNDPGPSGTCAGGDTPPACDGNVVVACVNGKSIEFDCGKVGRSCGSIGPRALLGDSCVDPAACTDGPATCVGSTLQQCVNGHVFTTSCTSLGLGACRTRTSDGEEYASCGPPP